MVTHQSLNEELVSRVPELRQGLAELREMWGEEEPGPHVTYGDLLVPYLQEAARTRRYPSSFVAAMGLLEDMLSTFDDDETRNVVGASVLEPLSGDLGAWETLKHSMGQHTRAFADQIEWG